MFFGGAKKNLEKSFGGALPSPGFDPYKGKNLN
jgi:hypothetical protein